MKVRFNPPPDSPLFDLAGVYVVREEVDHRYYLIVQLDGHTHKHPSLVYISAAKEHCEVVE